MLCISLGEPKVESLQKSLNELNKTKDEMAEIRLDILINACNARNEPRITVQDVETIFQEYQNKLPLIVTCRDIDYDPGFSKSRMDMLLAGMKGGAFFVDVEYEAPEEYKAQVCEEAKKYGCQVIVSYHNYELTPSALELKKIVNDCFMFGANVAKVAVKALSTKDTARVLGLYDNDDDDDKNLNRSIVALAMGEHGTLSRVGAILLGSPFTFVAKSKETATAPGQLTLSEMKASLEPMGWKCGSNNLLIEERKLVKKVKL